MEWEVFEKIDLREAKKTLSVYKTGQISLSKGTVNSIGSEYVQLLYNKKLKKIGIRAVSQSSPNVFKLKSRPRESAKYLNSTSFIRHYDLGFMKGNKYSVDVEGDMVTVKYQEPLE